jgi:DNA-directed RNA polymerase specialized sigma24 family protein
MWLGAARAGTAPERRDVQHCRYNSAIAIAATPVAAIGIAAIPVAFWAFLNRRDRTEPMAEDEFLTALTTLEDVLADNGRRASLIKERIAQLRRLRSKGASYTELVSGDDSPLIVQLLTESSKALDTSGSNVRRAEAQALHAEGMTMEQIADRFGVTRQRVSTLLRKARE